MYIYWNAFSSGSRTVCNRTDHDIAWITSYNLKIYNVIDFNVPLSRFKHVGRWLQEVLARQTVTGVVIV